MPSVNTKVKKTVLVETIKNWVNEELKGSGTPEHRQSLRFMIEDVLHKSGNYSGFRYLRLEELPQGTKMAGINIDPTNELNHNFDATDSTRVCYF